MINVIDEELDQVNLQVAQKMGWASLAYGAGGRLVGFAPGKRMRYCVPCYARDINAAWEIVTRLTRQGLRVSIANEMIRGTVRNFYVVIGEEREALGRAAHRQAAVAICLAFLRMKTEAQRTGEPCHAK
jgi:hypothetical protein